MTTDSLPAPLPKADLRKAALARRDGLAAAAREDASRRIAEIVLALPELAETDLVAAYWPIRSEVDVRPLINALRARGQAVALPQVTPDGLVFRRAAEGDALAAGGFGLSEPGPDAPAVEPRALLVPLAAFDRRGHRIGYGKGYYDRALARLDAAGPVLAVGVAFAAQETPRVPDGPHDRPLDRVVTEAGLIHPTGA
ncbi:5-formyltetrahydrofolate cyclo-ligase [Methylobacterium nonmethylotrophicum]|uniref:5-formyltetrahydrofolate cyclo-ligase n=1 Tax=Methylobacterium nonmethylotrophicum TaxID=1141884 RepID=A0A4Z0NSL8_9HYPH|nr:5-formyltetrahydrofolate cyclo-ligase [Methylobacterium nonmethylotrophicum]TGE00271.1 5-formyltetrahydrofolate cyclo-ligase [Methylobacterium nonmethylotrophicum]